MRKTRHRRGQATLELIPALVVFLMVISVSLSYFRAMRNSQLRQEQARNLIFAKINNSGTLTTTPDQVAGDRMKDLALLTLKGYEGTPGAAQRLPASIGSNQNEFINGHEQNGNVHGCYTVYPSVPAVQSVPIEAFILGALPAVNVSTYLLLYREPAGSCP